MIEAGPLLARLTGVPEEPIAIAFDLVRAGVAYERFTIPKLSPESVQRHRVITAPVEGLKQVQRALIPLLEPLALSSAVHGFRPGRSIVTGARAHLGARSLINVDLRDFFHSVDAERVSRVLDRSLFPRLVEETGELSREEARVVIAGIVTLCTCRVLERLRPVLPQGAPTSPFLANLAARPLDQAIQALLSEMPGEYVYTRYADDLTISSPHAIDRALLGTLLRLIHERGFSANPAKTRIASTLRGSPHYRQKLEVTGLVLDPESRTVRLPRARLDLYRTKLHQAALAPFSDTIRREVEGIVSFVQMVYGQLPEGLEKAYQRFTEAHGQRPIRLGKSRRMAKRRALSREIYR